MTGALIVMAKRPEAGSTKTRLHPLLGGEEAAALYRCFLLDTLALMERVPGAQPVIAFAPADAEPFFRSISGNGFAFTEQVGEDLPQRLDHVLGEWLDRGHESAMAVDSDSPTLPASLLERAFDELRRPEVDVVLGPCDDGGYYLIGIKRRQPLLFEGMVMSTSTVLEETLERADRAGLRVVQLPTWYDIDTPADIARLEAELRQLSNEVAPQTRAFLRRMRNEGTRGMRE